MEVLLDVVRWLQLHSILGMVAVFSLIVILTYWPGRRTSHERNGMIPLRDDR
jgi:cbb3-type cytochrome oxidase subunit 3